MAHFAKLNNQNIVETVVVGRDEDNGKEAELSARTGHIYKQTSYNTRGGVYYGQDNLPHADQTRAFRKNYAGIGFLYDPIRDAFISPKPFTSWVLNETSCLWKAPVDMPEDAGTGEPPKKYIWDEATTSWMLVEPTE